MSPSMKGKCVASAMAWAMVVLPQPAGPPTMKRGIDPWEMLFWELFGFGGGIEEDAWKRGEIVDE